VQFAVPDEALGHVTLDEREARVHLAIGMFVDDKVTLGQAARIAGLSQPEMLHRLGDRRIPIHYGQADLAHDLRMAEQYTPPER
jgi:predicted HTH domain antitoxin